MDEDEYEELDPSEAEDRDDDEEVEDRGDVFEDDEEDDEEEELESEEDDEEEEDPEEDSEDDDEEEEEGDDVGNRIPRGRLNQVIEQRDAERERALWLEDQLETLIKQQANPKPVVQPEPETPPEPVYDFQTAEEKYTDLLLEGSTKEAASLRREIDTERSKELQNQIQEGIRRATEEANTSTTKALESDKFETALDKAVASSPYLDTESDEYNEAAVKMANRLMAGYMSEGETKTKALQLALKDIRPLYETAEEEVPKAKLGKKTTERTKASRKKAVKAATAQPPETGRKSAGKATRDLDTLDIAKMSDAAFNKLSKRELAALRGD